MGGDKRQERAGEDLAARTTGGGRRSYERPRILSREPLEGVAVICQPAPPAKGNIAQCPQGPISS